MHDKTKSVEVSQLEACHFHLSVATVINARNVAVHIPLFNFTLIRM